MNGLIQKLAEQARKYADENRPGSFVKYDPEWFVLYNEKFAELIVAECLLPRKPLTEERIWEIKLKSHQKFMSRKWVEETDTRSGHYEDVERHTDSPVTFARAIEADHGIGE